jgi:hypothetical protein
MWNEVIATMQKEIISNIVKEVLQEKGLLNSSSTKPAKNRIQRPRSEPAVLSVFHAGVRKLEQALEQIRQIEKIAGRSSVFTVNSARSWVCGADVKEKAGTRCILDTVKPEGLEKALLKSDILILPTFCFKTAAKAAHLISDDQESAIVFSALAQGKKVLATQDGFTVHDLLLNKGIKDEMDRILTKLESFGMVFCKTDQLSTTFQKIMGQGKKNEPPAKRNPATDSMPLIRKLVTAKDIQLAVDGDRGPIMLAPGGIMTPLAKDLAKENAVKIIKT